MRGIRLLRVLGITAAVLIILALVGRAIVARRVAPTTPFMRAAATIPRLEVEPADYETALERFDLAAARRLAAGPDEQAFVTAMDHIANSELDPAIGVLEALVATTEVRDIRGRSVEALGYLLFFDQRWSEFVELAEVRTGLFESSSLDDSDLLSARVFATRPVERWTFPADPVRLSTDRIASGSPRVPVVVNGHGERFVIDTGASLTVLAEHVARRCGVSPLGDAPGKGLTSTRHTIDFRPAIVDRLELGALTIENHPVAILASEDLEFGLPGIPIIKIDGILGWPLFRRASFEVDYGEGVTTMRESTGTASVRAGSDSDTPDARNLFWLGYPAVYLRSEEGLRLIFGLDTGAGTTSIRPRLLDRISTGPIETAGGLAIGAGGRERVVQQRIRDVSLFIGGQELTFDRLSTSDGVKTSSIWMPDGQLGYDIGQGRRVLIDYPKGVFRIDP